MLAKMETAYLGLLRGFILVAATLALVAAAILLITTIPDVLTRVGLTQSAPPKSSLSEFIAEQKPQQAQVFQDDQSAPQLPVDPEIASAAKNIRHYLGRTTTVNWEQGLQAAENELSATIQAQYRQSLLVLSEELLASKGRRLTDRKVGELIAWHQRRFASTVAQQDQEQAAADAAFKLKIGAAFGALMLFVLIAFIFLFVRIERNLRVVRVLQAGEHAY